MIEGGSRTKNYKRTKHSSGKRKAPSPRLLGTEEVICRIEGFQKGFLGSFPFLGLLLKPLTATVMALGTRAKLHSGEGTAVGGDQLSRGGGGWASE